VETQFLDLPKPLALECGRQLHPVRIAYETYGTLSPARDNVILVCHALSGDATRRALRRRRLRKAPGTVSRPRIVMAPLAAASAGGTG
jgi:homoserine acetyltransferase